MGGHGKLARTADDVLTVDWMMHNGRPAKDRPFTRKNLDRQSGDVKAPHCFDTPFP